MYLKNLTIRGFKSFADKTELEFRSGITAVVGPNGSGKSNIADAVRWVLGEQSVRQLRGGKMEDVIFGGTQFRRPLGQASVSLTLDNSCQTLPVPYNEVTVTRRLYRSGESEYLINNNVMRLRDIHELFMDTGIGREGYSMIGQGKIDAILSGRPEERRGLVEEAAGITRYRARKEEGEKKLKNAQENLNRVEDIILAYEERLEPLKQDREKAEAFLRLSAELKDLQVSVILEELEGLEDKNQGLVSRHESLAAAFEEARAQKQSSEQETDRLEEDLAGTQDERSRAKEAYYISKGLTDELSSQAALLTEKASSAKGRAQAAALLKDRLDLEMQESLLEVKRHQEAEQAHQAKVEASVAEAAEKTSRTESSQQIIDQSEAQSAALKDKEEQLREDEGRLREELADIRLREKEVLTRQESLKELSRRYGATLEINQASAAKIKASVRQKEKIRLDLEGEVAELKAKTERLASRHDELLGVMEKERRRLQDAAARETILKNLEEAQEGYARSVRDLFAHLRRSRSPYLERAAVLGDVIKTAPEYAAAIEAALGGAVSNVITPTEEEAKALIELLKQQKLGRCTFLPQNVIKASRTALPAVKAVRLLGFASDLIETPAQYRDIADSFLARTLVARTMDDAVAAARETGYRLKIVTLDGDIIAGGGAMTGGSRKGQSGGILSRKAERDSLLGVMEEAKAALDKLRSSLEEAAQALRQKRDQLLDKKEALRQAELDETRLSERLGAFLREAGRTEELMLAQTQEEGKAALELDGMAQEAARAEGSLRQNRTEQDRNAKELSLLRNRRKNLFAQSSAYKEDLAQERMKLAACERDLEAACRELARAQERTLALKARIGEAVREKAEQETERLELEACALEKQQRRSVLLSELEQLDAETEELERKEALIRTAMKEASRRTQEVREEFYRLEKELLKASMNLEKFEEDKAELLLRLNQDLELTLAEARDLRRPVESKAKAQKRIFEIKKTISELGTVNLSAIEEYQRVSEHYTFLSAQKEDLLKAQKELLDLIGQMTGKMRTLFRENFALLSKNFKDTFRRLFSGGTAELVLADGDVLDGSIEIQVQPPGKKLQNLNLLSGGEKVLSAIALTFAILRMKPSPFCFLDEIEASLDDANVFRYANFIREFAKETQFILITHRKGTMEAANMLYGVTMEEKGISKIVSVDLDQLQEEAV